MKPMKNDPEICHSNYVSMFMEIGMTCTRLISILGNYDSQYIPFYFYHPMMSKAKLLVQNTSGTTYRKATIPEAHSWMR